LAQAILAQVLFRCVGTSPAIPVLELSTALLLMHRYEW